MVFWQVLAEPNNEMQRKAVSRDRQLFLQVGNSSPGQNARHCCTCQTVAATWIAEVTIQDGLSRALLLPVFLALGTVLGFAEAKGS
jgi:hypothetical protein